MNVGEFKRKIIENETFNVGIDLSITKNDEIRFKKYKILFYYSNGYSFLPNIFSSACCMNEISTVRDVLTEFELDSEIFVSGMMSAIGCCYNRLFKYLVDFASSKDYIQEGLRLLRFCVMVNNSYALKILLKEGIDPNSCLTGQDSFSIDLTNLKLLVEYGWDIKKYGLNYANHILQRDPSLLSVEIVKFYLDHDVKLNLADFMISAVSYNKKSVVFFLLEEFPYLVRVLNTKQGMSASLAKDLVVKFGFDLESFSKSVQYVIRFET